jgi:hypothetical protein
MDIGPQTLSITVTFLLILFAMGIALLVDFLKGNVEQLREVAVDLKARKESAEYHLHLLESQAAGLLQQPALAAAPAGVPAALPEPRTSETTQVFASEVATEVKRQRKTAASANSARGMSPAVAAVAESVAARMSANNGTVAGPANPKPAATDPVERTVTASSPVEEPTTHSATFERQDNPSAPKPASKKDWSQILNTQKHGNVPQPQEASNVIEFNTIRPFDVLPAGYQEYSVLQKVAECGKPFNGLIISIGLNQLERSEVGVVSGFLRSLLQSSDFACMPSQDEFLIVSYSVEGDEAQRRLAAVAERLWDFQLRVMGTINVQFAWGGRESKGERLNDAVAAAVDQMHETRLSRRNASSVVALPHIAHAV